MPYCTPPLPASPLPFSVAEPRFLHVTEAVELLQPGLWELSEREDVTQMCLLAASRVVPLQIALQLLSAVTAL